MTPWALAIGVTACELLWNSGKDDEAREEAWEEAWEDDEEIDAVCDPITCAGTRDCTVADPDDADMKGEAGDLFGWGIAAGADATGDGQADVIVSADWDEEYTREGVGAVALLAGRPERTVSPRDADAFVDAEDSFTQNGVDYFGGIDYHVLLGGDWNGDGTGDLAFAIAYATSRYDPGYVGAALMYGPLSGGLSVADSDAFLVENDLEGSIRSMSGYGERDANGFLGGIAVAVESDVFLWPTVGEGLVDLTTAQAVITDATGTVYGNSLEAATDLDGDGVSDVLVGSPNDDLIGAAYLFLGPISGSTAYADADVTWTSYSYRMRIGFHVASAGDVDGDGVDEALVGARALDLIYVVDADAPGTVELDDKDTLFYGFSTGFPEGGSASGAGDIDGDGLGDVSLSDPTHDDGAGAAYVFLAPFSGWIAPGAAHTLVSGWDECAGFGFDAKVVPDLWGREGPFLVATGATSAGDGGTLHVVSLLE